MTHGNALPGAMNLPPWASLELHTERLRLRPLHEGDAQALLAVFSDARVARYLSRPAWTSIDQAHERIATDRRALAAGEYLRLALEPRDGGGLVGECSLFHLVLHCRRAEVGYALAATAWGRGYMHEALNALIAHAFEACGFNRLEADIDPRNTPSARALERCGFVREGRLRERWIVAGEVSDSDLYGLLARDWLAARTPPAAKPAR